MQEEHTTGWQFHAEAGDASLVHSPIAVQWTASEYIAHEKSAAWYVQFALAGIVLAGVIYVLTRDFSSLVAVALISAAFVFFAGRKPRVLNYAIDSHGLQVGSKTYPMGLFKSFAVINEGGIRSVMLLPLKRFMPALTIYYAPEDEQKIIESLGALIPQEARQQDAVDRFMSRIRF